MADLRRNEVISAHILVPALGVPSGIWSLKEEEEESGCR